MKKVFLFITLFIFQSYQSRSQRQTENVILITLDGFRWQELFKGADSVLINNKTFSGNTSELKKRFWDEDVNIRREKLMPFFWTTIAERGQLYGNRLFNNNVNVSNNYWFSYPGYSEILTGFEDQRINSNEKINNPNSTVLEFINNEKEYKGKVAAFGSWDVIPFIINEERSGIYVNAGFKSAVGNHLTEKEKAINSLQSQVPSLWSSLRFDAFTYHYSFEYLKKNKPHLLFISFGETDDFAHEGLYHQYLNSAHQTDQLIKELYEWTQSDPQYHNKTTFIITTDHGRGYKGKGKWKHHGRHIKGSDEIWFAIIGPDTRGYGEMKNDETYYQNQLASTIASFFGKAYFNKKEVGMPLAEALEGISELSSNK